MAARSVLELWKELHAHPERSGHESQTAGIVAAWLEARGLEVERGIGGHGLLVTRGEGPYRLLRADMDAITHGDRARHGCGHDGHTAMLAGAIAGMDDHVAALFQPSEEDGTGMHRCLQDPRLRDLDVRDAFALHNIPGAPMGQVIVGPGALASTGVRIRVKGRDAHASTPQEGQSPYPALRALADAAFALRHPDGLATLVHVRLGDEAYGISPGQGMVAATLRGSDDAVATMRAAWLEHLPDGFTCQVDDVEPFPETINAKNALDVARRAAKTAGLEVTTRDAPWPWSEDFGHAVATWGGALIGLGSGPSTPPLHDDAYVFPTELLAPGIGYLQALGGAV